MTIDKKMEDSTLTVYVSGKLNTVTSPQFADALSNLDGITDLILDFTNLEQISSAGLRVLLDVQCDMSEQGRMIVRNVNDVVKDVFLLTGFMKFLTIE